MGCGGLRAAGARGVLVVAARGGRRRAASCSMLLAGTERGVLLSIAKCFSDCAMSLGLGASVYGRHPAANDLEPPVEPCDNTE